MTCYQDPNLTVSNCKRIILFLIASFECLLFGGIIFGWPQLVHLMKMENVYADLCNDVDTAAGDGINQYKVVPYGEIFNNSRCVAVNATPIIQPGHKVGVEQCAPQDERFALIFTLAVCCYGIPSFLVGYLLHHAGLWVTRIISGVMLCCSFIFLGMTTKEEPNWLFPAVILMALGGNQIRMSSLQLADLFPANKATALTILSGMYATSASLFLIFQIAEQYKIEKEIICWIMAALATFIIWFTFLMPIHHVPVTDSYGNEHFDQEDESLMTASKAYMLRTQQVMSPKEPSPLSILSASFSVSSGLHQLWLFAGLFAINVYQMTYNYWITIVSCNNTEVEVFSIAYSYVNLFSAFVAPLFGLLVDWLVDRAKRNGKSYSHTRVKEIQANIIPLLITTISTFILYLCLLFFYPVMVYVSLAFMAISRPSIVSVSTAYIRIRFPVEHFNRLVGIHYTITSILLLLQYPFFQWSLHMYLMAHGTVLLLVAVSILNPLHLCIRPLLSKTLGSPRQAAGLPPIQNTTARRKKSTTFSAVDQ